MTFLNLRLISVFCLLMTFACSGNNSKPNVKDKIRKPARIDTANNIVKETPSQEDNKYYFKRFSSISSLRQFKFFEVNKTYVTEGPFKGEWFWDSSDTKSIDNGATIIRSVEGKCIKRIYDGYADIDWFGAISNNKRVDNSGIIAKAIKSCKKILIKKNKVYYINSAILISKIDNISLKLSGSTISNLNYNAKTMLFDHCRNIEINGGKLTRPDIPKIQNNKDQHTLTFIGCQKVTVKNVSISNSPEMGICLMSAIGANITNNRITHTLRDGVYAHYSIKVNYIGNNLSFIKDDALSMHDYGNVKQKQEIIRQGYLQAGNSVIANNTITNAIQGISTIGCSGILIKNNKIDRTANAGIAVFNSEPLAIGLSARVKNIKIINNRLFNCGDTAFVNGIIIPNGGQMSSGRAAIYIASNGIDQSFSNSKLRLSNIEVVDNHIEKSAVNGILCFNIDGLNFRNNNFINCHANIRNVPQFTGNICEIYNCSNVNISGNNVLDNRKRPLHDSAYIIDNSSGIFKKGRNLGWRSFEIKIERSPALKIN